MSIPIPPSIGDGFQASLSSPSYIDVHSPDKLAERTNSELVHGAPWNKGVVLTKDSLDAPLETQFDLTNARSEQGRPVIPHLFQTRFMEDAPLIEGRPNYYAELRSGLSPLLQTKLTQNEQLDLEDKDPDIAALDAGLKFEAALLESADRLSRPAAANEELKQTTAAFSALPEVTRHATRQFGQQITAFLDTHLSTIGPNDPSYDLLSHISSVLKDAHQLLSHTASAYE